MKFKKLLESVGAGELGETIIDALDSKGFSVSRYSVDGETIAFNCKDSEGRPLRGSSYDSAEDTIISTCKRFGYRVRDDGPGVFYVLKGSATICVILMNQEF